MLFIHKHNVEYTISTHCILMRHISLIINTSYKLTTRICFGAAGISYAVSITLSFIVLFVCSPCLHSSINNGGNNDSIIYTLNRSCPCSGSSFKVLICKYPNKYITTCYYEGMVGLLRIELRLKG